MPGILRKCCTCHLEKPIEDFWKDSTRNGLGGISRRCKQCSCSFSRKQYHAQPDKKSFNHTNHLRSRFGLKKEEYVRLLQAQNGVCCICGQRETAKSCGRIRNLCVDHDHKTGKVRGLLCDRCNIALGCVKDNILLLYRCIDYLRKF